MQNKQRRQLPAPYKGLVNDINGRRSNLKQNDF